MPEAVLNAYRRLDAQSQRSVMDYIDFLSSKIKPVEKNKKAAYNKNVLALVGKVDIDEEAIKHFREISTL